MSLVEHAKRELELLGETDEEFKQAIIKAVGAFASYGHSGESALVGVHMLAALLSFKNLSPLTNDPKEWMKVGEEGVWQSCRNAEAFSNNGGKTYYLLSEGANFKNPKPYHRTKKVV